MVRGLSDNDIYYNLDILRGKVAYPSSRGGRYSSRGGRYSSRGGRYIDPSSLNHIAIEFLQIFATHVSKLPDQKSQRVVQLQNELSKTGHYVCKALGRKKYFSFEDVAVPLVGDKYLFAKSLDLGDEKLNKKLLKLPQTAQVRKIKGDGHCLFRSIGWDLLLNPKFRAQLIKKLQELQTSYPSIKEDIQRMLNAFSQGGSAYQIMNNPKLSDEIVAGLRKIACAYLAKHNMGVGEINQAYLDGMASMKEVRWGGHEEIHAIAHAFNLTVEVYDIGVEGEEIAFTKVNREANSKPIQLLHTPNHYHSLRL